jgi:glutamate-1-semialdehyde 2,1-aminomutase
MGVVPPGDGFPERLRELADQNGALLILDEVISGFRVARGGAQELLGVDADLTVMGKVIGGGLPAAAYGGRRQLMERIAPAGDVYQAGTLSGNPVAVAAALATLRKLDAGAYERLAAVTAELGHGIQQAAGERPVTVVFGGPVDPWPPATVFPGLLTVFFAERAPRDFLEASACDADAHARFCRALLERGVYPPASQFESWFPSLAHGAEEIELTVEACGEAFDEAFG